jgi:hypothetical protein
VTFESGAELVAGSGERYENWQVSAPGGLLVVGMPGDHEPAIWDGKD